MPVDGPASLAGSLRLDEAGVLKEESGFTAAVGGPITL